MWDGGLMTAHPTAPKRAIRHWSDFNAGNTNCRPEAPNRQPAPDNVQTRRLFHRIAANFCIGALLTFATAGATIVPASAGTAKNTNADSPAAEIAAPSDEGATTADRQPAAAPSSNPIEAMPETAPDGGRQEAQMQNAFLQFGKMRVPRWIVETILRAAEVTEVDPVYLMALADKESSFLPDNRAASSSAEGLFQFISSTWLEMVSRFGPKHGLVEEAAAIRVVKGRLTIPDKATRERILALRRDPYLSALMAGEMMKHDRAKIERRLGRSIDRSEFYLAHFFGVDSASKFMSLLNDKPKKSAPREFPSAAKANKALFFTKNGRKTRHLTVAEVYDKIDEMIDKRLARYENVATIAAADASL